ncbi:UDP-glucose 6-dehydrogenase [Alienimonas californiensis]|uniref:UDP-glucose 6-dehydrogenase n=2 Tax=Alienimonas californiensis TaxID=2527989 RepID=A0A517PD01_9PLAN|nr:UDP-glucose 6-dehydrogenase [Alienimonas californiensis]
MIGTGYVGLVTGTCFAESGNGVTCLDIDEKKVAGLNQGVIPIYEPGLTELVKRNHAAGRLKFTTDPDAAIPTAKCVFIGVGTPQGDDGRANLSALFGCVETIAPRLAKDAIVVIKSTVPVGTNRKVAARLKELTGRDVDVASNPEFLKEGAAVDDFTKPDRVVVGTLRPEVTEVLHDLYRPFLRTERPFLSMGWESAEMTKYVANCLLATKISFINEMANLCERVGADVNSVRRGIGHDQRIGFSFLFPGVGYGGSCFPKDVRALMRVAEDTGVEPRILAAVDEVNDRQKHVLFEKVKRHLGDDLSGKTVAVWGLAFKPRTDDIREAPALVLIDALLKAGATVQVHDPVAEENVREQYGDKLIYGEHHYDAARGADLLCICTEWNEFRNPDLDFLKHTMNAPVILDGRNLFDPADMAEAGFTYEGIGLSAGG